MEEEDERFSHIKTDPRFKSIPKWEKKIKIDKRFKSMFHDKNFKLLYSMDKRGRPVQHSTSEDLKKYYEVDSSASEEEVEKDKSRPLKTKTKHLRIGSSEPKSFKRTGDQKADKKQKISTIIRNESEGSVAELKDGSSEEESSDGNESVGGGLDLARGEGNVETSSSDDSSEDEEDSGFDHQWGEADKEVVHSEDVSSRLAVCNMDWDRIKAQDLYVLFNNFKPPQGVISSVKIYPSEFGVKRMAEEEVKGPAELTEIKLASDEEDFTETHEGSKYHMETLRKYQLNRLKYFYAVVDCDSSETASVLYRELDGMEYESSASQLDLRFIPDDMVFDHEPKDVADSLPVMPEYKPVLFTTKALQQTSVELTWDENNPDRLRTLERAFNGDADDLNSDLRTYLASSSSSEDEAEEDDDIYSDGKDENGTKDGKNISSKIAKYKELLATINEEVDKKKQRDIEMEITWEPGLKDKAESLIKMKQQKKEMTYFEQYLEKKKEKKKQQRLNSKKEEVSDAANDDLCSDDVLPADVDLNDSYFQEEVRKSKGKDVMRRKKKNRRTEEEADVRSEQNDKSKAELELLLMQDEEDTRKHFNLRDLVEDASMSRRKKKKLEKMKAKEKKAKTEDDFKINTEDPRFSALFSLADYNIDPSDTHFKKTKAMEALLKEKQKRRQQQHMSHDAEEAAQKKPREAKLDPSLSFLVKSVKNKTQNFKRRRN